MDELNNQNNFEGNENFAYDEVIRGNNGNNSKNKIIIPLVVIFAVVLVGVAFACTNLKYIFTPNKMKFITYLNKDIKAMTEFSEEWYDTDFMENLMSNDAKILSIDIDSEGKKVGLETTFNNEYLSLQLNNSKDKLYLLDFETIDKFYELAEIDPSEIPQYTFDEEVLKKEQKIAMKFLKDCADDVISVLRNDDFAVSKNQTLVVNGEEIKVDSIEVKINLLRISQILKLMMEDFRDSEFIDIYVEAQDEYTRDELIELLNEGITEIEEEIKEYKQQIADGTIEDEYMIYRMYYKGDVIARELSSSESSEPAFLFITTDDYYEIKMPSSGVMTKGYMTLSDEITKDGKITYHNIKMISEGSEYKYVPDDSKGDSDNPFSLGGSYEYVPVKEESFKVKVEKLKDETIITFTVETNNFEIRIDESLEINVEDEENSMNLVFTTNKDITKESLINDGAKVINDMTKDELSSEMMSLMFGSY